jgi:hypothetical protein
MLGPLIQLAAGHKVMRISVHFLHIYLKTGANPAFETV